MTDLDRIIADRDKALSLLREAVSPSGGDFCMCPELERRIEVFIADPLGEGNRLAALAGAEPVACGVVAENESVKVEAGFVYENGVHTPTVLVSFNPNDWAARDQFVAKVKAPHAPAKAREDDVRLRALYDAAAKGFHVSETCGPDKKYLRVSKFQSMADLHSYEDAWLAVMLAAKEATA